MKFQKKIKKDLTNNRFQVIIIKLFQNSAVLAQLVEHLLGKEEVAGSNPANSSSRVIAAQHFRTSLCEVRFCFHHEKIMVFYTVSCLASVSVEDARRSGFGYHLCGIRFVFSELWSILPDRNPVPTALT